jgi:hypothetical protein
MQVRVYFGEGEIIAPPRSEACVLPVKGFVICPLALQLLFHYDWGVQDVYRLAYEQARAAHCPSWYERLLRTPRN